MKKRKNMKNLTGYWVNKRSGTIHHVSQDTDWRGNPTLWATSRNLRWERDYHFRGDAVQRFQKNYEFICENATNEFYVNVLANIQLKDEYSWGRKTNGRLGITKEEFFNKVKGEA
jgi:hypothetical protein